MIKLALFLSFAEPKDMYEALKDEFWTEACYEELEHIVRHGVWETTPKLSGANAISPK